MYRLRQLVRAFGSHRRAVSTFTLRGVISPFANGGYKNVLDSFYVQFVVCTFLGAAPVVLAEEWYRYHHLAPRRERVKEFEAYLSALEEAREDEWQNYGARKRALEREIVQLTAERLDLLQKQKEMRKKGWKWW